MMENEYDVSVFIIDEENNYIDLEEYKAYNNDSGMFVCLTNDELNSDCGLFNNSICIYKDWEFKVKDVNVFWSKKYGIYYKYNLGGCHWQYDYVGIPNNEIFRIHVKQIERSDLKCCLDGFLSCQNIMSNITPLLKGEYKKEQYIPAIMTAYHTKVSHKGKTYRGYLPAIGQLLYISKNIKRVNDALKMIEGERFRLNIIKDGIDGDWWSSTEYNSATAWYLHYGMIDKGDKGCGDFGYVLPLFVL